MAKFDLALIPPDPTLEFEQELWNKGCIQVAGIDEAGRGPIAGPVAAAAVILPPEPSFVHSLKGVRDSKQMTPEQREAWAPRIRSCASAFGIGFASSQEIDTLGILPATQLAVTRALNRLAIPPRHLLLDFINLPADPRPQTSLVKGDARCLSIAAASVLAKTARDALLCELDAQYPGYGFAEHKGYCTPRHLAALSRLGPCDIHRFSFSPVKEMTAQPH